MLTPAIWIAFAERTGIADFRRTTRDEPDYDKLMRWRLGLLRQHGLKLADIQAVIAGMAPMDGAKDFLDDLRSRVVAERGPGAERDYFHFKPVWQRALIVAAGPIANFILAITIFAVVFMAVGVSLRPARVAQVQAGSPAAAAGFQPVRRSR